MGLASPAAAAILICYVWLMVDLGADISSYIILTIILIVSLSILMVSNIAYVSFKDIDLKQKVPHLALFAISLVISFISFDPPKVLFIFFLLYGLSGPSLYVLRKMRRNRSSDQDLSSKNNQ
jgi:CDP-diacylglycerol--serine O-phosphatidyltransferase